tara:strand:- start:383 stop:928 length:546 start_codon:yes stop_codon:yes gene_type:complete
MAIQINGNGTITGISSGGLPAGSITSATLASGAVTAAAMPTGSIIQVVQANFTTDQKTNSSTDTWQDIGLSANITMTDASNKVLVSYSGRSIQHTIEHNGTRIVRGSTSIREFWGYDQNSGWNSDTIGTMHQDTPGAGTHTYKLQMYSGENTSYNLLNYQGPGDVGGDTNQLQLFLMELKA